MIFASVRWRSTRRSTDPAARRPIHTKKPISTRNGRNEESTDHHAEPPPLPLWLALICTWCDVNCDWSWAPPPSAVGIWVVNFVPSLRAPLTAPLSLMSTICTWLAPTLPTKSL